MRVALDTNVLAYFEGLNGAALKRVAIELVKKLDEGSTFVPVQVLGELFNVLVRKAGYSPAEARTAILSWQSTFSLSESSPSVLVAATELAARHSLNIWDAIIMAAATEAGCRLLLSEDMQDGLTWNGVTVVNPFAAKKNELLAGLLR